MSPDELSVSIYNRKVDKSIYKKIDKTYLQKVKTSIYKILKKVI